MTISLFARRRRPRSSPGGRPPTGVLRRTHRALALGVAVLLPLGLSHATAFAQVAPTGNGFTVTAGDLSFILKQIKIAEHHAATRTNAVPCDTLVGPGPNQIPDRLTSYGLRTVDGSCNNLFPGREKFAAADVPFPRITDVRLQDAEAATPPFGNGPTSYKNLAPGNVVVDSQPRVISNLIVDQTSTNPAAVAAAGHPVRSQDPTATAKPCTNDGDPTAVPPVDPAPAGCTPSHTTLFIPNITTDVGLSPPFNSVFTFFGQFFDHGVDQTVKTGGTVFVPLRPDDPLITLGPDGKAGTGDEVSPQNAFMVLTRAQVAAGPDGQLGTPDDVPDATNTDTPWVDQSQTYTSHASHQVFLREYDLVAGKPVATGKLLGGALDAAGRNVPLAAGVANDQGISTWASTKAQARDKLGLTLVDADVLNQPMLAADPYGNFIPGPTGLPQWVTADAGGVITLVEGNLLNPVAAPANVVRFDTPFLTDIAHNADPSPDPQTHAAKKADADTSVNRDQDGPIAPTDYDDEGLAAHRTCGDGRCNENIALTAVHQIFHSEHDRLVDDITATLNANPALMAAYQDVAPTADNPHPFAFGERLFQAARFVTEMEYQHLVFEEFARKVVPAIRPFHVYHSDINAAVKAEFAHAVYRFGHSMLDDTVARVNEDAAGNTTSNSLPLLTAFLNPTEFLHNGAGTYTPAQAAGAIFMGSSDQTGNEIDEFVTETLRNNLLGLPLDLPTLNMARARDAGVPPLNEVRRQIHALTNDGALAPYTSWVDFGQHLKHPESLINFVAAYGQHPTIRDSGPDGVPGNGDDVTTAAAKRAAARAIVDPAPGDPAATPPVPADVQPADAADFMFGTDAWAGKETGLNTVDLWVGGLAEVTNLNGGHLGSTFNYVFQTQLELLQDGDRLYYLNRTPGMNLRTQLEGNSFSEIIQRNTDGTHTLKADAFATADCKFELGHLISPATSGAITGAGSVQDDPTSDCDENALLLKQPNGTFQYRARNAVDPAGINGQSVYNGTDGVDRVNGGNDNDTFWGGILDDVIEGNGGDDVALGGDGDDIITDLDGADTMKGGPGGDAIDLGPGDDIAMGGDGQDFINGGANDNEEFAGPGDDFVILGQGADAVFGDGGDDWLQGGSGQDLLQGDHGAPFFDDPAENAPGNEVMIGQVGENDYDAEGGDDVMSQNSAIDRNAGAGGFDWAFHQYDTTGADDDMKINQQLAGLPLPVVVNRDRWQETEADSGSNFNDVMRGDDLERVTGGVGFSGCDALDPTGVGRIAGLDRLVTTFPSALADVVAVSQSFGADGKPHCPLVGSGGTPADPSSGTVWAEGNVLLGGGGSDTLEGRGNNDVIDGDHALATRISVRSAGDHNTEIGSAYLMEHQAVTGSFGPGTTGMNLQQAVFAGLVHPSQLVATREIVTLGGPVIDRLDNPNAVPTDKPNTLIGTSADAKAAGDCTLAAIAPATGKVTNGAANCDVALYSAPLTGNYTITPNPDGSVTIADNAFVAAADLFAKGDGVDTLWNVEALAFCDANDAVTKNCTHYDVHLISEFGTSTPPTAGALPAPPTITSVTPGAATGTANVAFTLNAAPGAPITGTNGITGVTVTATPATGTPLTQTFTGTPPTSPVTVTGLANGTAFTFTIKASNAAGTGVASGPSGPVIPATVPGAPQGVTATAGNAAATVTWTAPADTGGSAIIGYVVTTTGAAAPAPVTVTGTTATITGLTNGSAYTFTVAAKNGAGTGPVAGPTAGVTPRAPTAPVAPTIGAAARANASATVRWTPNGNGGSPVTRFDVRVVNANSLLQVGALRPAVAGATSLAVTGLTNGTGYRFQVRAVNAIGTGAFSTLSATV
ncbi:MAG: hypothetical protein QOK35_852, partial [Pseudonocardiales bacterium]|nr:hypothetical protein [Pseudonocardiales bacterium]